MKRRTNHRRLSAEELVDLFAAARADVQYRYPDPRDPRRVDLLGRLLAEYGTDPVACIAARIWLRRGRPAGARRSM